MSFLGKLFGAPKKKAAPKPKKKGPMGLIEYTKTMPEMPTYTAYLRAVKRNVYPNKTMAQVEKIVTGPILRDALDTDIFLYDDRKPYKEDEAERYVAVGGDGNGQSFDG